VDQNSGSTNQHFLLMVALMMFFFISDAVTDYLFFSGFTTAKIGDGLAHDAFLTCFGVASGIFRGMMPSSDKEDK
jgi:hypothetical protein